MNVDERKPRLGIPASAHPASDCDFGADFGLAGQGLFDTEERHVFELIRDRGTPDNNAPVTEPKPRGRVHLE